MPEKNIRNLDIYVPNFDIMLLDRINIMTPDQRELIPPELKFKIFKKKEASVAQMNFTEKMYLLSVCFKQTIVISTFNEDTGIGVKDFNLALQAYKGKVKNKELLENMQLPALFVQSDKELMKAWQYMNHVQCSEIYELVKGSHPREMSKKESKYKTFHRNFSGLMRTIYNFESQKKDVLINFGLTLPKLYALLYFYDGEKKGVDFYRVAFKHAYTSNRGDMCLGMAELYQTGHLFRRGANKTMTYSITSKGIELLTRVMNKLIYNY